MAAGKKGNLMIVEDSDDDSDDLNESIDVATTEKTKSGSGKVSKRNKSRKEVPKQKIDSDTAHCEEADQNTEGKRNYKSLKAKPKANKQDEAKSYNAKTSHCEKNTHRDVRGPIKQQSVPTTTGSDYRNMPGLFATPPPFYPHQPPPPQQPPPIFISPGYIPALPGCMPNSIPTDSHRWPTNYRGPISDYGNGNFNTEVPRENEGNIHQRGRGNRSRGGFRPNNRRGNIQSGTFARGTSGETNDRRGNHSDRGRGRFSRGRISSRGTSENKTHSGKEAYRGTRSKNNLEPCDISNLEMKIFEFLLKRCASFSPFEAFLQKYSHFPENIDATMWFKRRRKRLRIFSKKGKIIYISAKIDLHPCRKYMTKHGCSNPNCRYLHICRDLINGWCSHQLECVYNHKFHGEERNARIIGSAGLSSFSDNEIANLLKQQYPKICPYRKTACRSGIMCPFLHICPPYIRQKCENGSECTVGHSFNTEHNLWILRTFEMDSWLEDAKKDRLLSSLLHLPKFPPRKSRDENKSYTNEQKPSVDEEDATSDHDSDITTMTEDNVSVYSDIDQEELSFSDIEQEDRDSSNEEGSDTDEEEFEDEEIEDEEIEEEQKYSRKNRFGPIADTEFLTGVQVDNTDD